MPDPGMRLDPGMAPMRAAMLARCTPAFLVGAERDILRGAAQHAR